MFDYIFYILCIVALIGWYIKTQKDSGSQV